MKKGYKEFTSKALDELNIEPLYKDRVYDVNLALVLLEQLNNRGSHFWLTRELIQELIGYILYLYSHIEQLEKDKRYLLKQKLLLYKENNKHVSKNVVKNEKYNNYRCPLCNAVVGMSQHYCCQCGQKLNWKFLIK